MFSRRGKPTGVTNFGFSSLHNPIYTPMPRTSLLLVNLFLFASALVAQKTSAERWDAYRAAGESQRANIILAELGISYLHRDRDSAELLLRTAFDRARAGGWLPAQASALVGLGVSELRRDRPEAALPLLLRSWHLTAGMPDSTGVRRRTAAYLIDVYSRVTPQQIDSSFYYYQAGLDLSATQNNPNVYGLHRQMGRVYHLIGDTARAAVAYEAMIDNLETHFPKNLGFGYFIINKFYFSVGNQARYTHYLNRFLDRWEKSGKAVRGDSNHSYVGVSISPETAATMIPRLEAAAGYAIGIEQYSAAVLNYEIIGNYWLKQGKRTEAYELFDRVYRELSDRLDPIYRGILLDKLYRLDREAENYAAALAHFETLQAIRDSLARGESEANLQRLQVQFETAEKEKQLAQQEVVLARTQQEKRLYVIGGMAVLLLGLAAFLFQRSRIRYQRRLRQQEKELADNRIASLERDKALVAVNAALEGQEKERMRIAKDLHDSLGGLLTAVKAHFNQLTDNGGLRAGRPFQQTNKLIDEACTEVRRISHNMMPQALAVAGLADALDDLLQRLETEGIDCQLDVIGLREGDLEATQAIMVYRVVQELLQNIQKHARADHVLLQLIRHQHTCTIILEDDGRGFDLAAARKRGGLGLRSIESRVRYLRGRIDWDAIPDEGTTVNLEIPLKAELVNAHAAKKPNHDTRIHR